MNIANKADREADLIVLEAARANAVRAGAEAIVKFMLRPEAEGMPSAAMAVHLSNAVVAAALPFLVPIKGSMTAPKENQNDALS